MLIGVGAESYLLDDYLRRILLHLLSPLSLLIEIFLVVKYFTNRRIGLRTYFNKIQFLLLRHCEGFGELVDTLFGDVFPYKADRRSRDFSIDPQFIFILLRIILLKVSICRFRSR